MNHKSKKGVLLINLGTPSSYRSKDVFRYLSEFLTDPRVIDLPWLKRQCLVRGVIVPFRFKQSALSYQQLWTEQGSPLLIYGREVQAKLQQELGPQFHVSLAMRYQHPSIAAGLQELSQANSSEIIVLPLFPQYASATTGSIHQKVMEIVKNWQIIPKMVFINSYPTHQWLIQAFCERGKHYALEDYDHILFSFHGLPQKQIRKADRSQKCLTKECCHTLHAGNQFCYQAQCYATAQAIIKQLAIPEHRYTICFQSRLGKDPWLQPYTSEVIHHGAAKGWKRLLVFCPAFVCDCLETTCEILLEYGAEFKKLGGERLDLVEGLNSHPTWIQALKQLVLEKK